MNKELYNKLFVRMNELGAIRKTPVLQWNNNEPSGEELVYEVPVLSDCLYAIERIVSNRHGHWEYLANVYWDFRKPYLHQQSDELGEKLFTLLK